MSEHDYVHSLRGEGIERPVLRVHASSLVTMDNANRPVAESDRAMRGQACPDSRRVLVPVNSVRRNQSCELVQNTRGDQVACMNNSAARLGLLE